MPKSFSRGRFLLTKACAGFLIVCSAACATDAHRALSPIELLTPGEASSWSQQHQDVEKILAADPSLRPHVEDIVHVLQAEMDEEKEQWDTAARHWLAALKIDSGTIGKTAFQRWAAIQMKVDPATGNNPEALARILLAETQDGDGSPWLKKQNLTSKAALAKRFQSLIGQKTVGSTAAASLPAPDSFADDISWEKRSRVVCRKPLDTPWTAWLNGLSDGQRLYWDGLLAWCEGESHRAAHLFKRSLTALSSQPEDMARKVRAADLQIQAFKAIGDRVAATEAYQGQATLLKRDDLPLNLLKWSAYEKQKRTVDSLYWVARNRAMQGDYERAKIAVHEGLDIVPSLQSLAQGDVQLREIAEAKIEGQHILASRVFYEQLDFAGALALNRVALETPDLGAEWKQRLLWSEGWYHYRQGDKAQAVRSLNTFLEQKLEDSLRVKGLYWKGRALWESGDKDQAEDAFDEIDKLAPLSFYAVVAVPLVDKDRHWTENFRGADPDALSAIDGFEWGVYRNDAEAIRRFHRLEIGVAAKLQTYYDGLGQELFERISHTPALVREVEPSLYASRLLHMARQYLLSISLSSQINQVRPNLWQDYPEQLLIFFPTPYPAEVKRFALQNLLEPELVWGLSRQESSFKSSVESPAGALGLMQLMPATAQSLARTQGISTSGISERLRQPDLNLQLGTLYLANLGKRYHKKWPQAIAAYNAGEYVVDTWIARRDAVDPVVWSEGLSFGETSSYVKNVWRNWEVYRWLKQQR